MRNGISVSSVILGALFSMAIGRGPDEVIGNLKIWHSDSQYIWTDSCGCNSCTHYLTSSYCTQDTPYRVHPVDLRGMGVIVDSFCVNPAFRLNLLSCVR